MDRQCLFGHASRFAIDSPVTAVEPLGSGHVNDTYRVDTAAGGLYVLQRINTQVFQRPDLVMANLAVLSDHVDARRPQGMRWEVPRALRLSDGSSNWLSTNGEAWRLLTFVEGAHSCETVTSAGQARELGRALGIFHRLIHDLPTERLADTLEGFHVTPSYLAVYDRVLQKPQAAACAAGDWCQAFVAERRPLAPVLEQARAAGALRARPIHGDPKVNNVMLCSGSGQAVAMVDLDTVKPGLLHYDIGDCLRSGCNRLGEESLDPEGVEFDLELCEAILSGYLNESASFLSAADIAHLFDAIRLIPFELGLRFYTDHLAGNGYFKVRHERHNLDRALVQFRLTMSIEAQESQIRALIQQLCP
ncbi:MAG: phosphotransferase [Cyanobacteriota bacterium]|jgi:Ser/Thr protein kinase RdoA (MazF antagonist)|nr:phosphotransferase [Cyanobacteriota bacterium]